MLKDLFRNRLFIGALAFFVLCVGGSLLYMQHVQQQSARETAAHEERLKQLTDRETRQPTKGVSSVAAQTEQVGHFHSDGTFHAEQHDPVEPPTLQAPQLQEYAQHFPEHLLEAQRLASVDMERSRAAFRAALPEDPFSAEFEVAVKDAVQTVLDLHPIVFNLPQGDPRRVKFAIANNLLIAVSGETTALSRLFMDTGNPVYNDRIEEILSWKEPYYAIATSTTQLEEEKNR